MPFQGRKSTSAKGSPYHLCCKDEYTASSCGKEKGRREKGGSKHLGKEVEVSYSEKRRQAPLILGLLFTSLETGSESKKGEGTAGKEKEWRAVRWEGFSRMGASNSDQEKGICGGETGGERRVSIRAEGKSLKRRKGGGVSPHCFLSLDN